MRALQVERNGNASVQPSTKKINFTPPGVKSIISHNSLGSAPSYIDLNLLWGTLNPH